MNRYDTSAPGGTTAPADELTPERMGRMRRWRQRLTWRNRATVAALPAALLLALGVAISVPLPAHAANLGSGLATHIAVDRSSSGAGNAITRQEFATARVAFSGTLIASARRTPVTLVLQSVSGDVATTVGTMYTTAGRVFNAQSTALPALFAALDVTPRAATTYRVAVQDAGSTVTSATFALTS